MEIEVSEFEKKYPGPREWIKLGSKINLWRPGEGWKIVMQFPFTVRLPNGGCFNWISSETCVLLALQDLLGREKLEKLFKRAYPQEMLPEDLEDWRIFLGKEIEWKDFPLLLDDLTDINYHSLREVIEEELGFI
jgi:hypothetical protein